MTAPATLGQLRDLESGASYPGALLRGRADALVLFAAGFHGRQDAVWIADAGLAATCVDRDRQLLNEMQAIYPDGWDFVQADVYEFAEKTTDHWDVVSLDCPDDQFQRCADYLRLWCDIARHAVILGTGVDTEVTAPDGWEITEVRQRSTYLGGVYWSTLERTDKGRLARASRAQPNHVPARHA